MDERALKYPCLIGHKAFKANQIYGEFFAPLFEEFVVTLCFYGVLVTHFTCIYYSNNNNK